MFSHKQVTDMAPTTSMMAPDFCIGCGLTEIKRGSRLKFYEHCEKCRLVLYCSENCKEGDFVFRGDKCPTPFLNTSEEPRQPEGGDVEMGDTILEDTSDEWETDSESDNQYKAEDKVGDKAGDKAKAAKSTSSDPSGICGKLEQTEIDEEQPFTDSSDPDFVPKAKIQTKSKLKKSVVGTNGFQTDSSTGSNAGFFDTKKVVDDDTRSSFDTVTAGYFYGTSKYEVFRQLVDCFRLHQDDEYVRTGEPSSNIVSIDFEILLDKAEASPGFLPTWWNRVEHERCIDVGRNRATYPNIFAPFTERDLIEVHENNPLIPTTLRLMAQHIYGRRGD